MEGLGSLLLFAAFFYFMMRFGCGAHMVHGHSHSSQKHQDPVCGIEVAMDKGYGKMHEGTLYRFCSRSCLDKFEADPGRYLRQPAKKSGGER